MQKAGASIYLGTAKELLVSTSAIVVRVRGENCVWGGLGGKLGECCPELAEPGEMNCINYMFRCLSKTV